MNFPTFLFLSLLTLFLTASLPFSSQASDEKAAEQFVRTIVDDTISLISSSTLDASEKEKKLTTLFLDNIDTEWMARFTLGRYWRDTDTTQRNRYHELYQKFLVMSYVPRFREYTNQRIDVRGVRDEGRDEFLVETSIISAHTAQPIRVNYKIRKNNKGFKVFDIIAEGVSLIGVQRSDFGSIVGRRGIDGLIDALERKTNS